MLARYDGHNAGNKPANAVDAFPSTVVVNTTMAEMALSLSSRPAASIVWNPTASSPVFSVVQSKVAHIPLQSTR